MSLSQAKNPKTLTQTGLSINELVEQQLTTAGDTPLYLSPLTATNADNQLSYYGKPIALTTQETKGLRKLSRLFSQLAEQGYIPPISSPNLAIEWGNPDSMRLGFLPLFNSYVHAKEFSIGKSSPETSTDSPECVFVTGTCMYGQNGAMGITDKGKMLSLVDPYVTPTATYEEFGCITSLCFEPQFHTYEIIEALSRGNILNGLKAGKVYLNIPITPYALYAKDAMARGIMDGKLMPEWIDQLKKRAKQLITYEQSICTGTVIPIDPLFSYLDFVSNPETTLDMLVDTLSQQDPWWAMYFEKNTPITFADIGSASYARVYYDQLCTSSSPKTVIAVEDQTEMRIFLETKKLIETGTLPSPRQGNRLIGLYPFTPIIFPDKNGCANATFFSDIDGQKPCTSDLFNMCALAEFTPPAIIQKAQEAYAYLQSDDTEAVPSASINP